MGNPDRLRQVIGNLLSNAIKYSPQGGLVEVSAAAGTATRSGSRCSDEGIGIPAQLQSGIFTKFFRADAAASGITGTGLGLAVSRDIIESHGGQIGFTSAEGEGTTFFVELPAANGREQRQGDQAERPKERTRMKHTLMLADRVAGLRPDHGLGHARLVRAGRPRRRSEHGPRHRRRAGQPGLQCRAAPGDVLVIRQLLFNKGIRRAGDRPFGHRLHLYRSAVTPVQRDVLPPEGQDRRLGLDALPRVLQARSRRRHGHLRQRAGLGVAARCSPRPAARAPGLPPERLVQ